MTVYNWTVRNIGIAPSKTVAVNGPMSGGMFNTEGVLGSNRNFTISWSGASKNAKFNISFIGQESTNRGHIIGSNCTGSSGSTRMSIPYASRGKFKIHITELGGNSLAIGTLNVSN